MLKYSQLLFNYIGTLNELFVEITGSAFKQFSNLLIVDSFNLLDRILKRIDTDETVKEPDSGETVTKTNSDEPTKEILGDIPTIDSVAIDDPIEFTEFDESLWLSQGKSLTSTLNDPTSGQVLNFEVMFYERLFAHPLIRSKATDGTEVIANVAAENRSLIACRVIMFDEIKDLLYDRVMYIPKSYYNKVLRDNLRVNPQRVYNNPALQTIGCFLMAKHIVTASEVFNYSELAGVEFSPADLADHKYFTPSSTL